MKGLIVFLLFWGVSSAGLLVKPETVIKELFPDYEAQKKSFLIGKKERELIQKNFRTKMTTSLYTVYLIKNKEGKTIAYSLLHSHRVRTKKETVLITMDKDCRVLDVEVIAFYEPPEFIPPERWLNLIKGRNPENIPIVKRNIPNITGSTLSAKVLTDAVRQSIGICKYYLREKFR